MILAIDSGGSKTEMSLFKLSGEKELTKKLSGFALAVDSDDPIPELESAITEMSMQYDISVVSFNIGGKNSGQVRSAVQRALPDTPVTVFRESDGSAALAVGEKYNSEIVLMAGTGAIVAGRNPCDGKCTIVGGWGANISDDGSGYSIGLNTLRRCILAIDGTSPLSPLVKYITGRDTPLSPEEDISLIRAARDSVRSKMFPLDRGHIASFTKTAAEFYRHGDPLAVELFEEAGAALGKLLIQAARKLELKQINGITATGGLTNARECWAEAMKKTVSSEITVNTYHFAPEGLIIGTFEKGKELLNLLNSKEGKK